MSEPKGNGAPQNDSHTLANMMTSAANDIQKLMSTGAAHIQQQQKTIEDLREALAREQAALFATREQLTDAQRKRDDWHRRLEAEKKARQTDEADYTKRWLRQIGENRLLFHLDRMAADHSDDAMSPIDFQKTLIKTIQRVTGLKGEPLLPLGVRTVERGSADDSAIEWTNGVPFSDTIHQVNAHVISTGWRFDAHIVEKARAEVVSAPDDAAPTEDIADHAPLNEGIEANSQSDHKPESSDAATLHVAVVTNEPDLSSDESTSNDLHAGPPSEAGDHDATSADQQTQNEAAGFVEESMQTLIDADVALHAPAMECARDVNPNPVESALTELHGNREQAVNLADPNAAQISLFSNGNSDSTNSGNTGIPKFPGGSDAYDPICGHISKLRSKGIDHENRIDQKQEESLKSYIGILLSHSSKAHKSRAEKFPYETCRAVVARLHAEHPKLRDRILAGTPPDVRAFLLKHWPTLD